MFFGKKKLVRFKIFESLEDGNVQLPINEATIVKAFGKKYCVAHTKEGFFAVDNSCPHQDGPLGHGYITENNEVICPWHRYQFDLKTGKEIRGVGCYIETYQIEIDDDGIFMLIPKGWF